LEKIRIFLALNVDKSVINRLKLAQDDVRAELGNYNVKWEDPAKFHMTLRFLGDFDQARVSELVKMLSDVDTGFECIKFSSKGIGFFPNHKFPNVVFVDFEEEGSSSAELVEGIDKVIGSFGIKPDKAFVPHVTLGRFRRENRVRLNKSVEVNVEPIELEMHSFHLMKSTLNSRGSVYEDLKEFGFKK